MSITRSSRYRLESVTVARIKGLRLCFTGKWCYADESIARRYLAALGSKPDHLHGKGKAPCRAYRCTLCPFWHLTSKPRRRT